MGGCENVNHLSCAGYSICSVPNAYKSDPDIQHLPVFAVTSKFFNSVWSTYHNKVLTFDHAAKFLVGYQHYLFYPVMALARSDQPLFIVKVKTRQIFLNEFFLTILRFCFFSDSTFTLKVTFWSWWRTRPSGKSWRRVEVAKMNVIEINIRTCLIYINTWDSCVHPLPQIAGIVVYWSWVSWMLSQCLTWKLLISCLLLSHAIAGILHVQVISNGKKLTTWKRNSQKG